MADEDDFREAITAMLFDGWLAEDLMEIIRECRAELDGALAPPPPGKPEKTGET